MIICMSIPKNANNKKINYSNQEVKNRLNRPAVLGPITGSSVRLDRKRNRNDKKKGTRTRQLRFRLTQLNQLTQLNYSINLLNSIN